MDARLRHSACAAALAILLVASAATAAPADESAMLIGTVTNAETGEALGGAHVFLAETMIGTVTDHAGRFHLARVPLGVQRVYASMIGFAAATCDTLLRTPNRYEINLRLRPEVVELTGVAVEAERDHGWDKRRKRFERHFIGETPNAEATALLNPEVLALDGRWGRLTAEAEAPLQIENQALGYRVQYFLEEFNKGGTTIRYDGEPLFEELTPESPEQAEAWAANRERSFRGSFRHFLLALLGGRCREEGFAVYRRFDLDRSTPTHRLRPERLLRDGPTPDDKILDFRGYVEIVYLEEEEHPDYLRWQGRSPWDAAGAQRSWIRLTDGPTRIDRHGEVIDPYGVTVYGYFAFEGGVADTLPKEYRP